MTRGECLPPTIVATPFRWRDPRLIPPREWLFGRHAIRGFVSVTGAQGGLGKTALLIAEGIALASGRDLLTDHMRQQVNVWYVGLEDPLEEYERRVAATMLKHEVGASAIEGSLFVDSGRDQSFVIASEEKGGVVVAEPIVEAIVAEIKSKGIGYLIVDPFIASHRVEESANSKVEVVARQWARIAQRTGIAVELVHHLRKGNGSNASAEPSADELRGASALVNAARSVRILVGMTKDEAEKADVEERWRYFAVRNVKANLAPRSDAATWRRLASISLGNGGTWPSDEIGAVERWTWPDAFADISPSDLRRVQQAVAGATWRESAQASEWVGKAVADTLGLDIRDKPAKAKVSAMLKTWVANDALKVVERPDEKRMPRKWVEVGTWVD